MKPRDTCSFSVVLALLSCQCPLLGQTPSTPKDLWELANQYADVHRYSTLFPAHDVERYFANESGIQKALDWCKETGVTKACIEEFRDGYQAERGTLENAKQKFQAAGFLVSGCVTTTKVGKPSTGWKDIACYTDKATQEKVQAIFEYAASLFDEIMIDDFWFSDCTCPECDAARISRKVIIGEKHYPVSGDSWEDYHCELMVRVSQDRVLGPAKRVNPKVKIIIKYPQWYDDFHNRGYEVLRETADFDRLWVGTETRNYEDKRWGGIAQYEGYFIMRWLGGIGGAKCGGGWFDPFGTTEVTYVEQARQTILGGARESMLFAYGPLQHETGPRNIEALRSNLPELFAVAKQVNSRQPIGVAAYKPANSHPGKESKVFDFVGMLGVPLVPCHQFPTNAPAAFFSVHALKDPAFVSNLKAFIKQGKPVLLTDGLVQTLTNKIELNATNVRILTVKQDPKSLLQLDQKLLDQTRDFLLRPLKLNFTAPNKVAFYLFSDRSWVIENFNQEDAAVTVDGKPLSIPARGWRYEWR